MLAHSFLIVAAGTSAVLLAVIVASRLLNAVDPGMLSLYLRKLIVAGDIDRALKLCRAAHTSVTLVARAGLEAATSDASSSPTEPAGYRDSAAVAPDPRAVRAAAAMGARRDVEHTRLGLRMLAPRSIGALVTAAGIGVAARFGPSPKVLVATGAVAALVAATWWVTRKNDRQMSLITSAIEQLVATDWPDVPAAKGAGLLKGRIDDRALSAPPRHVPFAAIVAELLAWSWWYLAVCAGFFLSAPWIPHIAAWSGGAFLALAVARVARAGLRLSVLRWGVPANVFGVEDASPWWNDIGGGWTYQNIFWPLARGWDVSMVQAWAPHWVRVRYRTDDGREGGRKIVGHEWKSEQEGGVILCHARHPGRAYGIVEYPYDLVRTSDSHDWDVSLRARTLVSIIVMLAITFGVAARVLLLLPR